MTLILDTSTRNRHFQTYQSCYYETPRRGETNGLRACLRLTDERALFIIVFISRDVRPRAYSCISPTVPFEGTQMFPRDNNPDRLISRRLLRPHGARYKKPNGSGKNVNYPLDYT